MVTHTHFGWKHALFLKRCRFDFHHSRSKYSFLSASSHLEASNYKDFLTNIGGLFFLFYLKIQALSKSEQNQCQQVVSALALDDSHNNANNKRTFYTNKSFELRTKRACSCALNPSCTSLPARWDKNAATGTDMFVEGHYFASTPDSPQPSLLKVISLALLTINCLMQCHYLL